MHCMKIHDTTNPSFVGCKALNQGEYHPFDFGHSQFKCVKADFKNRSILGLLQALPQELCEMVAMHLVREYAIFSYQNVSQGCHSFDCVIDLSSDIYASYLSVEGIDYLKSLRSAPESGKGKKGERIFQAGHGRVIRKIYAAHDHLGIRSIHFDLPVGGSPHSPRALHGVWWTEISNDDGFQLILLKSDGLKIRRLLNHLDCLGPGAVSRPSWPTPGLNCILKELDASHLSEPSTLDTLRMSYFDCNNPTINSLSVAIFKFHLSKLQTHYKDVDSTFYKDVDASFSDMLWMYMPIDEGEYLREIWTVRPSEHGGIAIMLITNQERAVVLGNFLLHPSIQLQFDCLKATGDHSSGLYFEEWDPQGSRKWIKYMGLDASNAAAVEVLQLHRSQYPLSVTPSTPPPYTQYNEPWYYTNCRLENIATVTCCVNPHSDQRPIIGMLLHYSDGRRACVGQYRTDWPLHKSTVDSSTTLRIGLGKNRQRLPYVAEVLLHGSSKSESSSLSWVEFPWSGRLEWWFSQRQCKLVHSDVET